MPVVEDVRGQIERLVQADPTLSAAAIGRAVKLSRARVGQILAELGYAHRSKWEYEGSPDE